MLEKILYSFLLKRKRSRLLKLATYIGLNYDKRLFIRSSNITLKDGSTPGDIIIGNKVWMWGTIQSQSKGKVVIEDFAKIGGRSVINCVDKVVIGKFTAIADDVHISDNNNHPVSPCYRKFMRINGDDESRLWKHSLHAPVIIGENCWIGRNVSIMKGVTIGDNSVIAANSVVTKSVPANCIAAGNPAKVVKTDIDQISAPTSCKGYNEYLLKISK